MSEVGRFSQDTSVIIATMMEFAQRMLTNLPTVALTSETPISLAARSPTRASEPRTEITRPKDVTVVEPGMVWIGVNASAIGGLSQTVAGETVKRGEVRERLIVRIPVRVWYCRRAPAGCFHCFRWKIHVLA